jgi:hypothetical protein
MVFVARHPVEAVCDCRVVFSSDAGRAHLKGACGASWRVVFSIGGHRNQPPIEMSGTSYADESGRAGNLGQARTLTLPKSMRADARIVKIREEGVVGSKATFSLLF